MSEESTNAPDQGGEDLCPCCLEPVYYDANFCGNCGAPQGFIAATAPFLSVLAEGFIYRRAVSAPTRGITVCGIWLIFGLLFIGGAGGAYISWKGSPYSNWWRDRYDFCVFSSFAVLGIIGAVRCTLNYVRYKKENAQRTTQKMA